MKLKIIPLFAICFVTYISAQEKRTIGSVERLLPEIDQYVAPGAEIEILAEGFGWSEGPVWVDRLDAVIFSDVPANKAYRWTEKEVIKTLKSYDPSNITYVKFNYANDLTNVKSNKFYIKILIIFAKIYFFIFKKQQNCLSIFIDKTKVKKRFN